ncbi:aldose 1-epimerase family protein [Limosilactobacillus caecicola]|uniref:aldose 1-epimerase family protein n=1 Tax=Limosilactobacillus caecicola TaxID=2941332 RepID=UPI00203DEB3C|nr:aldose 1-epimerase family protein [Limosilactobacillus caecicola]
MLTISDDDLIVQIDELGAQPHSIKLHQVEYLWQGDPASWKRQAPILFPFVGRLKDDQYEYQGKNYHQTQHGFARDEPFTVIDQATNQVTLQLRDNERTRAAYPFHFVLRVTYQITNGKLNVTYQVTNAGQEQTLIYAIGAHPGFNVPLNQERRFTDVIVKTSPAQEFARIPLVGEGPYNDLEHPQMIDLTHPLRLTHQLFAHDALVVKTAGQPAVFTITDDDTEHGVRVKTQNNPVVGIWSPYPAEANLLCIEPWWGIADGIASDGHLTHKQLMNRLQPGKSENYHFQIQPF